MARMIPATIHPSVVSAAERRMFHLLASAPHTEDWVCLHSLALARHAQKRRGEIDFLLLTRQGIFVLEIKGGGVSRHDGVWRFTDRFGDVHQRSESPFDQAAGAMFALESDLRARFQGDSRRMRLLLGYGVMFPDVAFDTTGTEADRALLYDARDRRRPVTDFVARLATFARTRDPRERYAPSQCDIEALVEFLRPDFDLVPSLGALADAAAIEMLSLEKDQYAVIDTWEQFGESRVLVQGGAGTGKTLLALEAAVREARNDRGEVLLLCYNRLLARFLDAKAAMRHPRGGIVVSAIYAYLNELISRSPFAQEFNAKRQAASPTAVYRELYPEYASLALLECAIQPFAALIVDEAQDMMLQPLLDVLDSLLAGGLESGAWRIFCDVNNQASVFGAFDPAALDRLKRFGTTSVLTANRRNTKPVSDETIMLTRPRISASASVAGVPVQYSWYRGCDTQSAKLAKAIGKFLNQEIAPGRITVLSPRRTEQCCAASLTAPRLVALTEENVVDVLAQRCPAVTYCSISSFKGLENDFIILTDVDDLTSEWWRSVIYVGMSRARIGLCVLLSESLRATYGNCLRRWLEERSVEPANQGALL